MRDSYIQSAINPHNHIILFGFSSFRRSCDTITQGLSGIARVPCGSFCTIDKNDHFAWYGTHFWICSILQRNV